MGGPGERRDVVIVGGGAAALTAAIYLGRAGLAPLLLEGQMAGGQAATTCLIENYPGFPEGVSGADLAASMEAQARRFDAEIVQAMVTGLEVGDGEHVVRAGQEAMAARAVIVATGATHRRLGVPGEKELLGRGVSFCATCDGPLYRGREVVVVGGGDSAVEEALFLARFASKITVVHRRGELRAVKILRERAFAEPKISFLWHHVVTGILGSGEVTGVRVANVKGEAESELPAAGVFVYIGTVPNTKFLPAEVVTDEQGFVVTDLAMRTSAAGVFAAGDVRSGSIRQVVAAAGDGAVAADSVEKHLESA